MILACILIFLAAVFNAVMDKTKDYIQYRTSLFYGLDERFWSDEKKTNFIYGSKYKPNAWHLSKSAMLICLLAIPFVYKPFLGIFDYLIFGTEWILIFNLFYNKLLKRQS